MPNRPIPDADDMRALAVDMSKVHPEADKELRRFIDGELAPREALSSVRAVVRELVYRTGKWGGDYKISPKLRAEVNAWAARHGTGRETDNEPSKNYPIRFPLSMLDDIKVAAELAGVSMAAYVKQAVGVALERDLAKVKANAA